MKLSEHNTAVQMEAYLKQMQQKKRLDSSKDPVSFKAPVQTDNVELSHFGREVQRAAQMLKQMPDVRRDMVQQVRLEIETGTYKVAAAQVAADMLRESFENNLIMLRLNALV